MAPSPGSRDSVLLAPHGVRRRRYLADVIEWCWWAGGTCVVLALIATAFGIAWSASLAKVTDNGDGTFTIGQPDGWPTVRGTVMLGIGLGFTTLAGLFALLIAPPWTW